MKVYVVTWGCYSDTRIVGVFSREEDAQAFASKDAEDGASMEWEVDESESMGLLGLTQYDVVFRSLASADCEVSRCRFPDAGPTRVSLEGDIVWVACWAKDEQHARKIGAEQRAMKLAATPRSGS